MIEEREGIVISLCYKKFQIKVFVHEEVVCTTFIYDRAILKKKVVGTIYSTVGKSFKNLAIKERSTTICAYVNAHTQTYTSHDSLPIF